MQERTKRIAKNSVLLYIKMGLSTIIGLYTGRVILNVLGINDFGIYNVVGGIVMMFGFLNASMSAATSRFITFELGRASSGRLQAIFSASFIIHLLIAVVVLLLSETIGLWMLNNKLVIPEDRMLAAHWVLQFSILSSVISITQVPYTACIIAYEKMKAFTIIEIINSILKLVIVYLLSIGNYDKLILYSILVLVVSLIIAIIYRVYCIKNFRECRKIRIIRDKDVLIPLLSFSGWDLYGNGCGTARQQGINFLINMYFGVALNAAAGIANVVSGVVAAFTSSVTQAFRPSIIKDYADNNIRSMERLMSQSMYFSILLLSCMMIPLLIETNFVLNIWLGIVPNYASSFTRILMITCLPNIVNAVIVTVVHATGKIKYMSFITGTIFLLNLPLLYIWLNNGGSPLCSYISALIIMILVTISNTSIAKYVIPQFHVFRFYCVFFKVILIVGLSSIIPCLCLFCIEEGWFRLILVVISYFIMLMVTVYFVGLDKFVKQRFINYVKKYVTCYNV